MKFNKSGLLAVCTIGLCAFGTTIALHTEPKREHKRSELTSEQREKIREELQKVEAQETRAHIREQMAQRERYHAQDEKRHELNRKKGELTRAIARLNAKLEKNPGDRRDLELRFGLRQDLDAINTKIGKLEKQA
jgi:hypothetical protein